MGLEDLTEYEIISGILGLIAFSISLAVGIIIVLKYFQYKRHELLTVGLQMIFVSSGWWASLLSFVLFILFDFYFPTTLFLILTYGIQPITHLFWIYSFAYLVYPKSKWKFFLVFFLVAVLYEIHFWYFMIVDPTGIAIRESQFIYTDISPIIQLYVLFILVVGLITVYNFSKQLMRSDEPKTRWRGKFLMYSMILLAINAIVVIIITVTQEPWDPTQFTPEQIAISIVLNIIIYVSTILSYFGWIMPEWLENRLIKES